MNRTDAAAILEMLQACFPTLRTDARAIEAWRLALDPIAVGDVRAAVVCIVRGDRPHGQVGFPPSTDEVFLTASDVARERFDREESERRRSQAKLDAQSESTTTERTKAGAAIRDALRSGRTLADVLRGVGKPVSGPPTARELNDRKNRLLDELSKPGDPK